MEALVPIFAQLLGNTSDALIEALSALFWPLVFFIGLALVIRRSKIADDLRRVLPETSVTFGVMLFNVVVTGPVLAMIAVGLVWLANTHVPQILHREFWMQIPVGLTVLAAIIVGDFTGYWRHRFEHTRWLWPSHAVHHSDTEMTWFALERFHPVNRITTFVIDTGVLMCLGFPAFAIVANALVRHYYGFLIHADLPWTWGSLGRVFVSPAMHRWHHADDPIYFKTNFATVFSVWDQMFGTYRVPGRCTAPLGVSDDMGQGAVGQLLYPLKSRAYRR